MKRYRIAALLFSLACSLNADAALKTGDAAPDFTTQASLAGKPFDFSLSESLKKGPVVVYFYPSAFTNGCNIQAHTFAVNHEKFAAAGATIIGVSLDSIARLNEFSAHPDYCAGKVAVASDADSKIAKSFDVSVKEAQPDRKDTRGIAIDHGFAERATFIITPAGKIAAVIGGAASSTSPKENVEQALAAVQQLASTHASTADSKNAPRK